MLTLPVLRGKKSRPFPADLSGIEHWFDDPNSRDGAVRLQRQMFDAVREVGRVAQQTSIDCHFERAGALEVAVLPAQLKRLHEHLEYLHRQGFSDKDYRWLSAAETRGMLNIDQSRQVSVLVPGDHEHWFIEGAFPCREKYQRKIFLK